MKKIKSCVLFLICDLLLILFTSCATISAADTMNTFEYINDSQKILPVIVFFFVILTGRLLFYFIHGIIYLFKSLKIDNELE